MTLTFIHKVRDCRWLFSCLVFEYAANVVIKLFIVSVEPQAVESSVESWNEERVFRLSIKNFEAHR